MTETGTGRTKAPHEGSKQGSKYTRVMRFVTHYWLMFPGLFGVLLAARIASTLVDVSVPLASGVVVDAIASGSRGDTAPVWRALAIFIGLGALFAISRQLVTFLLNRLSARTIVAIGRDAFGKVQRFSSDWHANSFAGSTVRKITRGMSAYDTFTDTMAFGLLPAFIVVVGVCGIFWWRWPMLGIIVAVSIAVFLIVTIALSVLYVRPANIAAREQDSRMSGVIADSVTGNAAVKSFAAEEREDSLFREVVRRLGEEGRALVGSQRRQRHRAIAHARRLAGRHARRGRSAVVARARRARAISPASSRRNSSSTAICATSASTCARCSARSTTWTTCSNSARRTCRSRTSPARAPLVVDKGRIEFDRVTFRYSGASAALYEDFSLVIPAGQRVGLVGHSGAGKSTFVKLIQRLYDVDKGRILIDGQDIAQVTQESLRRAVGLVPQEPILFHRTLAQNIAYGKPDATRAEIEEAARLAHVDLFVRGLAKGYETLVGERGVKLSGGERQRVAIARAILAATPILDSRRGDIEPRIPYRSFTSARRWIACRRGAPPSSSRTACPRSSGSTASSCSRRAASSRTDATTI